MFITLHVTRMSHTGAVCSGDYLTEAEKNNSPSGYLMGTGAFLKYFIIIAWLVYPAMLITTLVVFGPKGKIPALILDSPK